MMIRIFNGTHEKTYIEREFSHIVLPERALNENIFEIGRLFSTAIANSNSIPIIMARVAEYFKFIKASGSVYLDANQAAMRYYKKFGATVVYTPDELKIKKDSTPLWVMKFSVEQIINTFSDNQYQSVPLKTEN